MDCKSGEWLKMLRRRPWKTDAKSNFTQKNETIAAELAPKIDAKIKELYEA